VNELGRRLLGDERVHAGDRIDELRLEMDAGGGRLTDWTGGMAPWVIGP
jgi:hypothetical protein